MCVDAGRRKPKHHQYFQHCRLCCPQRAYVVTVLDFKGRDGIGQFWQSLNQEEHQRKDKETHQTTLACQSQDEAIRRKQDVPVQMLVRPWVGPQSPGSNAGRRRDWAWRVQFLRSFVAAQI